MASSALLSEERVTAAEKKRRKKSLPFLLRCVVTAYISIILFLSSIGTLLTQILLWVFLFPLFIINKRAKYICLGMAFRFWSAAAGFWLNPFWRLVIVRKAPKNYSPKDTLVMLNHTSAADPWICATALFPWELKYIIKGDLLKLPIFGYCLKLAGDIPVYFTKEKGGWGTAPGSTALMMKRVEYYQQHEIGQVIFPEGTRSKTGGLQPFKDGFFRYALEHNCEILPCVMHNAQELWPLGSRMFETGTAYFAFGDPIRPLENETIENLKERVREIMLNLLKLCPLYDPEIEKPVSQLSHSRGQGLIGLHED